MSADHGPQRAADRPPAERRRGDEPSEALVVAIVAVATVGVALVVVLPLALAVVAAAGGDDA